MIKVKKFLSLFIIVFLILSNFAFAGAQDYAGDFGAEFTSSGKGSSEEQMTERFARGELSEEDMRAMAKAKSGDKFDEVEFKKGIMEFKERMERKDTFSYEHEGYGQRYYVGPSYEGYSKEQMVFGMIFRHIGDDIDPREIKQYCSDPNKVADLVITKLKDKVGDLQKLCTQAEEQEAKCAEHSKKACSQIGTAMVRGDATEMEKLQSVAYSCPVNKDAIVEACKKRSLSYMEQRIKNVEEACRQRFDFEGERLTKECERFRENTICDKEKFIDKCTGGIKKEDFKESVCPLYPIPQCSEGSALHKKVDERGCISYYCEISATVCTRDAQQCPDGSYVSRDPANNCNFKLCPTDVKCPEAVMPTCDSGQIIQKKVDSNGCIYYYCKAAECPSVSKPICNADETLQAYYDNAGCVTSYQCIRHETCPTVSKPTCLEGQSLTTKYDDKGCVTGYECVSVTTTTANAIKITGSTVLSTYGDYLSHCGNSWFEQQKTCSNMPSACDKGAFIEKCKEQEKRNYGDFSLRIEKNCELQTQSEIKHAEQRCAKIDEERSRCLEKSAKRCEQMKGVAEKCRETLTEENLRKFIVEETKKRCKFTDIIEHEDDIRKSEKAEIVLAVLNTATEDDFSKLELFVDNLKEELELQDTTVYKGTISPNNFGDVKLLPFVVNAKISSVASSERAKEVKAKIVARQKVEEAAGKLASLRDSDVPAEYLYIIEDKASEVIDVSDELGDIEKKDEGKGVGYKIRLFLGLAKRAEQEEIKQLEESKNKLSASIDTLTKLVDEVPSDVAKAILKEQVESLKKQQDDIEVLIETKDKKSKGLLGLFG